jgi:hypothetical protein
VASVESCGDESAVWLPPSEGSSGICSANLGLLALSWALFVRDGGVNVSCDEMDIFRFLLWVFARCGGGERTAPLFLATLATSTDCDLVDVATSLLDVSAAEVELAQCCERMDRLSSMGVKILRDLIDIRFTGSSICA